MWNFFHNGLFFFSRINGTNINLFAHYSAPEEEDGTLEYHRYQYASADIKDTHQGHKDGRRDFRNEQDQAAGYHWN
jgi:hypothetical protein